MSRPMHLFQNKNLDPLTDVDLKRMCPAIFAKAPREDVSSRYGFVPTIDLVKAMRENGFEPTQVNSYHRRDADQMNHTKHLIRFRPAGNRKAVTRGDVVPMVNLLNSHDRSCRFELIGGLWRLVCENGLMVSEGANVEPMIVRHTTSAIDGLLDAAGKLIKQQKYVFEHVDAMKKTVLSEKAVLHFAEAGLALRPERAGVIDPRDLLAARRTEDAGNDVWRVYNRVQENMIRGGQRGITGLNRAVITRGVTSVNADVKINIGLWALAMEAIAKASASSARATRKATATA